MPRARLTGIVSTGTSSWRSPSSGVRTEERRRGNLKPGATTRSSPLDMPGATVKTPRSPWISKELVRLIGSTPPLNSRSAVTRSRHLKLTWAKSSASPSEASRFSTLQSCTGGEGRSLSACSRMSGSA